METTEKAIAGTITIRMDITQEFLSDLLVTAFDGSYGGSWYWARPNIQSPEQGAKYWLETDGDLWTVCHIRDLEDPDRKFKVDHQVLIRGIEKLFEPGVLPGRGDIRNAVLAQDSGNIDVDAADVIVQLGCFGELVYG
jgi:hypothetical protein